jgi:hypothetical protein
MDANRGRIQKATVVAMLALMRAQRAAKKTLDDMQRGTQALEERNRPRTTPK